MRKLGVPVVYYISPQLWAWRRGRMKTMRRIADRVLVIFPFEEAIYREAGIPAQWVGHPLLDLTPATLPREEVLAKVRPQQERRSDKTEREDQDNRAVRQGAFE